MKKIGLVSLALIAGAASIAYSGKFPEFGAHPESVKENRDALDRAVDAKSGRSLSIHPKTDLRSAKRLNVHLQLAKSHKVLIPKAVESRN